jgi:hypothetical protein
MRARAKLKGERPASTLHVFFTAEDKEAVEKVAQMKQITKSEVVRQAVDLYLSFASIS